MYQTVKKLVSGTTCALLVACTTTNVPLASPDIFINSSNQQHIISEIMRYCDERNLYIASETDLSVTCTADAGATANLLFGTKYGSGVSKNAQFNLIPYIKEGQTKVTARAYLENQNAYGGIKRTDMETTQKTNAELHQMLKTLKSRVEG